MAIKVTVPRLGWSMDEGTLTEWLKRDGEFVRKGDMVFVLEGDKAAQEIESFDEGILKLLPDGPRPGDTVQVGQLLAYLVAEGEQAPFDSGTDRLRATRQSSEPAATSTPGVNAADRVVPRRRTFRNGPSRYGRLRGLDVAPRSWAWTGSNWSDGTGRNGRIREKDVLAALGRGAAGDDRQAAGQSSSPFADPPHDCRADGCQPPNDGSGDFDHDCGRHATCTPASAIQSGRVVGLRMWFPASRTLL